MIRLLLILAGFLWLVRSVRAVAMVTALWQQKEYRLDRMRAHLSLMTSRRTLLHPLSIAKWAALVITFLVPGATPALFAAMLLTYAAEASLFAYEASRRLLHRPQWTVKAVSISLGSVLGGIGVALLFVWSASGASGEAVLRGLLLGDCLLPVIVTLLVVAFHPVSLVFKNRIMDRARARRAELHSLRVVGITGSYGKSSTKEILATLLGNEDRVLKTPANTNTEIGVAALILSQLTAAHAYVICEMGAYRRGEIARLAAIAQPSVGIVTAIAPQHLALFGSLDAVRDAKYELIAALPADGVAIFNADDPICEKLAQRTRHCRVIRYGRAASADVRAEHIRVDERGTSFTLHMRDMSRDVRVPLLGAHQVQNVLAAVAAATALGVPLDDLVTRAAALQPLSRTMEPRLLADGTRVIDDSYSANPDGVLAALSALKVFHQPQKIVIMPSMIELGSAAPAAHERAGAALAASATRVFLTDGNAADDVLRGVRGGGKDATFLAVEPRSDALFARIQPLLGKETVLLLEGRIPTRLRERLLLDAR